MSSAAQFRGHPTRWLLALTLNAMAHNGLAAAPTKPVAEATAVLSIAAGLRTRGCGSHTGSSTRLRRSSALDQAAQRWATGVPLQSALDASDYRAEQSAALHVSGDASALAPAMARDLCTALTDPRYRDIGSSTRGRGTWIVVAVPFTTPAGPPAATSSALVLRINVARSASRRCGRRTFPPAPPLRLNPLLSQAAAAHAEDMLAHNYFAHESLDGGTPADRIAAAGYRYHLVGENIAFGPESAAEAVAGWLASPDHCENIMDPRFAETGVAYASNGRGAPRIYWVQEFATPARPAPR